MVKPRPLTDLFLIFLVLFALQLCGCQQAQPVAAATPAASESPLLVTSTHEATELSPRAARLVSSLLKLPVPEPNREPNDDGTITVHFNAEGKINNITSGGKEFNYIVRNYGVSQAALDKTINPVKPEPVQ